MTEPEVPPTGESKSDLTVGGSATKCREPLPEVHLSALARPFLHWLRRDDEDDIFDLNAPYQRGSVWSIQQRRALIKSLYMGVPVGAVIVSKLPYRQEHSFAYRIIDGKQRVETIRLWAEDMFTVPGWWFDPRYVSQHGDEVSWSDLSTTGRRRFETGTQLAGLEFDVENVFLGFDGEKRLWRRRTDDEQLRAEAELYGLVNGGGTPQTTSDLARAAAVAAAEPSEWSGGPKVSER